MQRSFSELEYAAKKKVTRRDRFLSQINAVTPWAELVSALAPQYPKSDQRGRLPIGLERMLRMYVVQQCFGFSDEGIEDAVYDKQNAQRFAKQQGISEEEAEKRLSQQANRQIQAGAAALEDSTAREFLKQAGRQLLPADPASPGLGVGYLFFATLEQKNNSLMYVDSLILYADFFRKNDIRIPSTQQIVAAATKAH